MIHSEPSNSNQQPVPKELRDLVFDKDGSTDLVKTGEGQGDSIVSGDHSLRLCQNCQPVEPSNPKQQQVPSELCVLRSED